MIARTGNRVLEFLTKLRDMKTSSRLVLRSMRTFTPPRTRTVRIETIRVNHVMISMSGETLSAVIATLAMTVGTEKKTVNGDDESFDLTRDVTFYFLFSFEPRRHIYIAIVGERATRRA